MCPITGKNPYLVDVPRTVTIGGTTRLYIKEVVWQNPGSGAVLTLRVNRAAIVRKATANNTDYSIFEQPLGFVDPFVVVSMTGGILEVWIDDTV